MALVTRVAMGTLNNLRFINIFFIANTKIYNCAFIKYSITNFNQNPKIG